MAASAARNAKSMSRLRQRLAASAMALAPAVAYGLAAHDAAAAGTLVIDSRGASYVEHFAGASRRAGPTVDGPVTLNLSVLDGLGGPAAQLEPLTEREREVLQLAAQGLSNAAIARALGVAAGTVKRHLANVYGKLDASGRVEAVARGRSMGWIDHT